MTIVKNRLVNTGLTPYYHCISWCELVEITGHAQRTVSMVASRSWTTGLVSLGNSAQQNAATDRDNLDRNRSPNQVP